MSYQLFIVRGEHIDDDSSSEKITLDEFLFYIENNSNLKIEKQKRNYVEVSFHHENYQDDAPFMLAYDDGVVKTVSVHVDKESLELLLDMSKAFKVPVRGEEGEVITEKDLEIVGTNKQWIQHNSKYNILIERSIAKEKLQKANYGLLVRSIALIVCIIFVLIPYLVIIGLLCIIPLVRSIYRAYESRSLLKQEYVKLNNSKTKNNKSK